MHIGIHTRWSVLEAKLERREDRRSTTETWQLSRLPQNLSPEGGNRLYVAVDGAWRGYFALQDEILYCPEDARAPYSLIFDTRTWVDIRAIPTRRFRGFTYDTPADEDVVALGS